MSLQRSVGGDVPGAPKSRIATIPELWYDFYMKQLPKRKPNRLHSYDYSSVGAYFVTVCVQDMRCILSEVKADDMPESAYIVMSETGETVNKILSCINAFYHGIRLDHFIVMPNHVHLLISVTDEKPNGAPRTSPPTNALSNFVTGFKKFSERAAGCKIWQRSFHDHIIRSDDDYCRHWQYIDENPKKWIMGKDAYYGYGTL